ncbi:cell division protein FtsQ/DivIB [Paenibacillus pinistramenti]|uniref:cell division protein FtsQ/DivIB n=1 Tax=Paenibacillus pinistramenti TaxID=1768003 RepID=UPI001108B7D6|nr:FtsQ-type POTRA domain-containing protein [Paenibacillus pinistramenti]
MPKSHIPALKNPKPKKNTSRKVAILLIVLFIVLLTVLFFRSSVSKITEIQFRGSVYSSNDELLKQSGLKVGASFFGTSAGTVSKRLQKIPSIQSAAVDKRFPGVVEVTVNEYPSVAYELSADGKLMAYLSNGSKVLVKQGTSLEEPMLSGWDKDQVNLLKLCTTLAKMPKDLTSDFSEILPSPTLSFPDRIKLYTRSGFEVLTTISLLPDKAEYLNDITETQEPGLITMLEADTYVPFASPTGEE